MTINVEKGQSWNIFEYKGVMRDDESRGVCAINVRGKSADVL